MLNLKVHHIGYLVRKKDAARAAFTALGYEIQSDWVHDELRGIDISFLEKDGYCIELVCPYRKDSDVSGLLQRMKNTPYHICYLSGQFESDLSELREMGYLPITEKAPAPALENRNVVFLLHPALGMIELIDHPEA
ncbi:MAG: VOC family protein [Lachnospiraceae bacterium]|nr:VOC family protein [Lachnospiraceae bacterium]